jgi:hypothetical protein
MSLSRSVSDQVNGKTVRLAWTDGPTKGSTHEHVFHRDGTVEWRSLDARHAPVASGQPAAAERAPYMARDITDQVVLVSYLSSGGYTLTVTLNFRNQTTMGVASNEKTWAPVQGTFEVVHQPAVSIGAA